jgi:hypothetical protein
MRANVRSARCGYSKQINGLSQVVDALVAVRHFKTFAFYVNEYSRHRQLEVE